MKMARKYRQNQLESYFSVHIFKAIVILAFGIVMSFCIFTIFNRTRSINLSETQKFFARAGNFRCPQETFFSKEEIATHASSDDLWIVVDGNVLDVSQYEDHPGGPVIFDGAGGDDAAEAFIQFHQPEVVQLFSKFCIGRLQKE